MKEYNFSKPGRKNHKEFFKALFITDDDSQKVLMISKEASAKINDYCSKNQTSRVKFVPNEKPLGVFTLVYMRSTYMMMAYQAPDDKKEIAEKRIKDLLTVLKLIYKDLYKDDVQGHENEEYWNYLYYVFYEMTINNYDDSIVLEHHVLATLYDYFYVSLSDSNFKLPLQISFLKNLMLSTITTSNLTNEDTVFSAAIKYWQDFEAMILELYYQMTTVSLSKRFLFSAATVTGLVTFIAPQFLVNLGLDMANSWLTNATFAAISISSFTASTVFLPRVLSSKHQRKLTNLAYEMDTGRKLSKQEMDEWLTIAPEESKRVYLQSGIQNQMLILEKQFALVKKESTKKPDEIHYSAKLFESPNTEPEKRNFISRLLALGFTMEEIKNLRHTKIKQPAKQTFITSKIESKNTVTWLDGLINSNMPGVYEYQPPSGGLQYIMLPINMLENEIDTKPLEKFLEKAERVGEGKAKSFRKVEGNIPVRKVIFNEIEIGERAFTYEIRAKTPTNTKTHQRILFFELQNKDKVSIYIGAWYLSAGLTNTTSKQIKAASSPLKITLPATTIQTVDTLEEWKQKKGNGNTKPSETNFYSKKSSGHVSDSSNSNSTFLKKNVMY